MKTKPNLAQRGAAVSERLHELQRTMDYPEWFVIGVLTTMDDPAVTAALEHAVGLAEKHGPRSREVSS